MSAAATAAIGPGSSAWASSGRPRRASTGIAWRRSDSATPGNSSTPDGTRKHLNPRTPAAASPSSAPALPGTTPPQKPQSTRHPAARAAWRLASRAATEVVAGMLLSGMSTIVVMPPAAAARVAVANPSHSVRPGSFTCTWVSTSPGIRQASPASTVSSAAGASSGATTAAMRPPATTTAAARSPWGNTTRCERMTRSGRVPLMP